MSTPSPISFRAFSRDDIAFGMQVKQTANWNQVPEDWELLLQLNSGHHLLAEYNQKPAGTLTAVDYENRFRWIGMLLVAPAYRKKGLGTALLKEAVQDNIDLPIRLDATPAGKPIYRKMGFQVERELYRMERRPQPLKQRTSFDCQPLKPEDLEQLKAYDHPIFGADRSLVLQELQQRTPAYAWCIRQGDQIAGYCLGRQGSHHLQIGPIVANDRAIARALLLKALTQQERQAVIVDTFIASDIWMDILTQLGFNRQRPLTRMYKGDLTHTGMPHRQFAIAGPELG